jgi:hypothetical protein
LSNDDKNFEEYLEGKSSLSEKYAEIGAIDPPAELGAAILAEAGRAAKTHSHSTGKRSWAVPLSVAATVMICFSLVLNVLREAPVEIATDQEIDALIPAEVVDAAASEEAFSSNARRAVPAEKKESELAESMSPAAESPQVLLNAPVASRGRMNKDGGQAGKSKSDAEISSDTAVSEVEVTGGKQQKGSADAPLAVPIYRLDEMDSDELTILAQMMEVVSGYLDVEETRSEDTLHSLESPVDDKRSLAGESEISAYSDLASLSATEEKPGRLAQAQVESDEPDSLLQRIVDLYKQSEKDSAAEALAEFRQVYPDHPVSRALLERGY